MTGDGGRRRAVLFDFFGTLVTYQPDRNLLGYPDTHARVTRHGYRFDHARFVTDWDTASAELEDISDRSHDEFSMTDAASAFARAAGLDVTAADLHDLGVSFVAEWQRHIRPVDGMVELVRELCGSYRLGIVSNTHDPNMVPALLADFGIDGCFDVVTLSVVHGRRKPHPAIYLDTLDVLQIDASSTVFVGDSFDADYHAPTAIGMDSFLITTDDQRVPERCRLASIVELRSRLRAR
ncbi:MAG: HAD family hydrolase [Ilumatobacteraceae bacterium]